MDQNETQLINTDKRRKQYQSSYDLINEEKALVCPLGNHEEAVGVVEDIEEIENNCIIILKNVHFLKIPKESEIVDFLNKRKGKKIAILNCDGKLFCRDVIN